MLPQPLMHSSQITVLVVDDEAPARQRLTDLLRRENHITAIHEATDGRLAIEAIADFKPDLVFLDVQMPELDGLHVIESVGAERMPLTVFVTAFDQHAIAAFEANAVDYLLKPFSDERFASTMARVRSRREPMSHGEFHVVMRSGARVKLSRTYRAQVELRLGQSL
jgi:two-component system LytT family response regulator